MIKVFVSGCYDILHAGHIEFFKAARKHGDHLTVCFAGDEVYRAWKGREPAMPEAARRAILEELRCVDGVVMSRKSWKLPELDFRSYFNAVEADILVSTTDDRNAQMKRRWCEIRDKKYIQIPKPQTFDLSTTDIRERIAR